MFFCGVIFRKSNITADIHSIIDLADSSQSRAVVSTQPEYNGTPTSNIPRSKGSKLPFLIANRSKDPRNIFVEVFISRDTVFSGWQEKITSFRLLLDSLSQVEGDVWFTPQSWRSGEYHIGYKITPSNVVLIACTTE